MVILKKYVQTFARRREDSGICKHQQIKSLKHMNLLITIGFFTTEIIQNDLAIRKTLYCYKNKAIFGENICNTPHNNKTNIFFTSTRLPSVKIGIKRSCKSPIFPVTRFPRKKARK